MDLNLFPNEILEEIFQHLDSNSKLEVMSTCSRFESIIVQKPSLSQEMKLIVNKEMLADPENHQALKNIRRKFAKVQIDVPSLQTNNDQLNTVLQMLEGIGTSINCLTLSNMKISNEVFLMMIKLTNPEIMKLYKVRFSGGIVVDANLGKLKNLIINDVRDLAILVRVIPSTLESLAVDNVRSDDWEYVNEILSKQQNLQKLKLTSVAFESFNFSPSNASIVSLELNATFFERDSFQSCISFVKTLGKLKEARLHIWGENRTEAIKHVLGLHSLELFHLNFDGMWMETLGDSNMVNSSVKTVILDCSMNVFNCHDIVRCFPTTIALTLNVDDQDYSVDFGYHNMELEPLQALNLRALQLSYITNSMIKRMSFNQLREIQFCDYDANPYILDEWKSFFARTFSLEILCLPWKTTFDLLKLAFDIAQLKKLMVRGTVIIREEQHNELIELLQRDLNKLVMFRIKFRFRNNQEMLDAFKISFPNVKLTIEVVGRTEKIVFESKNFNVTKSSAYGLVKIE
jgi:hypothetical protein